MRDFNALDYWRATVRAITHSFLLLGFSKHQNVCQGRANKEFKNAGSKIHKYNDIENSGTTCFYIYSGAIQNTPSLKTT